MANGAFVACNCAYCNGTDGQIIWIDVNGYLKPPNIIGKDVFGVKVYQEGLRPLGYSGDGYENTCATTGVGCLLQYLAEK